MKINNLGFFLMLLLITSLYSCSTTKTLKKKSDYSIEKIKNKFAPDSRVAVFSIKAINSKGKLLLKGETNLPDAKSELIRELNGQDIEFIDNIELLPQKKLGNQTFGVVRLSVCNIRTKPKHSAELATQAILGTPVNILKENNGWYFIQTTDNYLGWVDNAGITQMTPAEKMDWITSPKVIYNKICGFVYKLPDTESAHISDLVEGAILKLMGESLDNRFWIVAFPDDRMGYILKKDAEKLTKHLARVENYTSDDILTTAKELMGTPYLWGGTSTKMLDCSGFTKTVFFIHGLILPRDASQQVNIGKKITINKNFSNLKPGDLLFFGKNRKDGTERITHVAIYMGNGKIIHEAGEVKIQSLKKGDADFVEYRLKSLKQARRIIGYGKKYGIVRIEDHEYYGLK